MPKSPSPYDTLRGFESARARGIKWKPPKEYKPHEELAFNQQETLSWWRHIQKDHWWKTQMPINTRDIDQVLGRGTSFRMALNPRFRDSLENFLPKVSRIILDIEARAICFTVPWNWVPFPEKYKGRHPRFVRISPPDPVPKIGKLVAESFWSLHARCLSCENNKFLPVEIDSKPHVACYHCIAPSQYAQIGATAVKKSLIHEVLKKYY